MTPPPRRERRPGLTGAALVPALGAALGVGLIEVQPAEAQGRARTTTGGPLPVETMASVVIGAVFQFEPAQPVFRESGPPTDRCAPWRCYRSAILVRSNSRWQLEARVDAAEGATAVSWRPDEGPPRWLTGAWQVIHVGSGPTPGVTVPLRVAADGATPPPDAATISGVLRFRVVGLP